MIIHCPQCLFERDIDPSQIPSSAVMATCPKCGIRFRFRSPEGAAATSGANTTSPSQPAGATSPAVLPQPVPPAASETEDDPLPPGARVGAPQQAASTTEHQTNSDGKPTSETSNIPVTASSKKQNPEDQASFWSDVQDKMLGEKGKKEEWSDVPWERPDKYGVLGAFVQTLTRVMFAPTRFFAALPQCKGRLIRPAVFYILLGMYQTIVKLMWMQGVAPSITDPNVQALFSPSDVNISLTLLFAPGILLAQMLVYAVLFFLMLRLVQPERVQFAAVTRVIAYSSAPMIVCIVPGIGPVVGAAWFAACCFIGCKYALGMDWSKVALALVPLYLIGFALTVQFAQHLLGM